MLKHLPHFVAAAEEGGFQAAADRLHMVQSALSRRIAELESELGVRLFDRLHQGVRLTPAGRVLLNDARGLLREVERIRRNTQLFDLGEMATLHVGFNSGSLLQASIVDALQIMRQRHPGIVLKLMPMLSEAQFAALDHGTIDVGLAYDLGGNSGFERRDLLEDALILALPDSHRLAHEPVLTLRLFEQEDFIWSERSHASRMADLIMAQFTAADVTPRIAMEAGSTESMLSLVSAGVGLGFVNRSQRGREPRNVLLRSVADFHVPMPLRVIWMPGNVSPALERFVDVVSTTVSGAARIEKSGSSTEIERLSL